ARLDTHRRQPARAEALVEAEQEPARPIALRGHGPRDDHTVDGLLPASSLLLDQGVAERVPERRVAAADQLRAKGPAEILELRLAHVLLVGGLGGELCVELLVVDWHLECTQPDLHRA